MFIFTTLRRALAFRTVYIARCHDMSTYIINAKSREAAKAALYDEGVNPETVGKLNQAHETLDGEQITRL